MASGPRRPIIVADDDAELRLVIVDLLTEAGFFVFAAASGDEVLDIMAKGVRPCLIVFDWHMPGLPGRELLRRIADDMRNRSVPFVLMTGTVEKDLPRTVYMLRKPFTLAEIVELASAAAGVAESAGKAVG